MTGLRQVNGDPAAPPYSNGPYKWDQHVIFSAGVAGDNRPGNFWYVNASAASGGDGKSWTSAFTTIQTAVTAASAGDIIYVAPGGYNETVTVSKAKLALVGVGGRGSAFIEPSTAGAEGMQVTADDVTLVNIGVAGDETSDYALNLNAVSRFRAFGCKFELGDGTSPAVLLNGTASDQCGDNLLYDCEFAWAGSGILADDSVYGYVTQTQIRKCYFHNLATVGIGVASGGLWKNLEVTDCVFDNKEDGTAPTDYILLSNNGNTGIFSGNRFATATNDIAVLTIGTGLKWVTNATEAGISAARPA